VTAFLEVGVERRSAPSWNDDDITTRPIVRATIGDDPLPTVAFPSSPLIVVVAE